MHYTKLKSLYSDEQLVLANRTDDDQSALQEQMGAQLSKVIAQMDDLAAMFRQISMMVVEQGSVMDRIDFNVLRAKEDTAKSNMHLRKALEYEKSNRSTAFLVCLLVSNAVCVLILLLRWTHHR